MNTAWEILGRSHWLMEPRAFRAMVHRLTLASDDSIRAAMQMQADSEYMRRRMQPRLLGDVAVIEMSGPIFYRDAWLASFFGGFTIEEMQAQFRAALNDPACKTVLFRVNSPGGVVDMVPEFADEIFAGRDVKPIVAVADVAMCSAAYWLASQASAIYATPSSIIGSIGVFVEHTSIAGMLAEEGIEVTLIQYGEHKTDGNMYQPLPDDVKTDWQADVDEVGKEFVAHTARGRGVTPKYVLDAFGQGKCFRGKRALSLGMADKTGTFGAVVGKLTKGRVSAESSLTAIQAAAEAVEKFDALEVKPSEALAAVVAVADAVVPEPETIIPDPESRESLDAQQAALQERADEDALAITVALGRV